MKVVEAIRNRRKLYDTEIELIGEAHISDSMTVIYDKQIIGSDDCIYPGVLVHGDYLANKIGSLPIQIPALAGTEILYVVDIKINGIVTHTGQKFAPLKFRHIYEIVVVFEKMAPQTLKLNDYLKDIDITISNNLKAQEVKRLQKYFDGFDNMIELKKYLENGELVRLISRVPESHISEHVNLMEKLKIEYNISDSPIDKGSSGLP
ncbi:MAG: hypothetical protein GY760_25420 [Deltaproteobacteria bacterium]|nr:hypothetical protein [Deltaproteobacteria bacterium]